MDIFHRARKQRVGAPRGVMWPQIVRRESLVSFSNLVTSGEDEREGPASFRAHDLNTDIYKKDNDHLMN